MKKMTMVLALVFVMGWANASFPVKLDFGTGLVEPGYSGFQAADSGVTLYDGVKVTVAGSLNWRVRSSTALNGAPNEQVWRDFVFGATNTNITITIEGLSPNKRYELSLSSFDIDSSLTPPRAADWKVNGETLFTSSFGMPGVPLATLVPKTETDYVFSGITTSDATGKIVLQSAKAVSNGGGGHTFVNAVTIDVPTWAYDPQPADGAAGVALDASLTWKTGPDPNNPATPNAAIGTHYLYVAADEPNFIDVTPIEIPAGSPVQATGSYGPMTLDFDTTYYWRVDEGVYVNGVVSGKDDPATLRGKVWSFASIKSIPIVTADLFNRKVEAGQTAQFAVEYTTLSTATVTWYKGSDVLMQGGKVTIVTTDTGSTLTIAGVDLTDEGVYSCTIQNAGGTVPSKPAQFAVARLLARYEFEQNLLDSAGGNHGAAVGDMAYAEGAVGAFSADPNGSDYVVLSTEAYPKAGFGNGLDTFTYSYWTKLGSDQVGAIFGNFNDGSSTGVQFYCMGGGAVQCFVRQEGNSVRYTSTPAGLISEKWHFIAGTYDGPQLRVYIDGVEAAVTQGATLTNFAAWQYPTTLLARNNRNVIDYRAVGQADDLRIYNYALSPEAIAQLYYDITGNRPCVYGYPKYDISGPEGVRDCVVDIYDFADFATGWLSSGLFTPEN